MADVVASLGSSPGDTLIVLSKDKILQVHASIIRVCCEAIAPLLIEEQGAKLNHKIPGRTGLRWRVDLVYQSDNPNNKYFFVNRPVNEGGLTEPVNANNNTNHDKIDPMLLNALFDTIPMFYHHAPVFDTRLRPLVAKCLRFLRAGKIFGALPSVRGHLEKAIINCADPVLIHVVENPAEWLYTALNLQSQYLFKEALIHLIGKWKIIPAASRGRIGANEELRNLVILKLVDVWQQKKAIERQLLGFHPQMLKDVKADTRKKAGTAPGRSVYATHIFPWIALCLYRQWFGQMIAEGASLRAADGGYSLYTALSKGGDTYIRKEELKNFYSIFPMTEKAKSIIENSLTIIKEGVKDYVTDLVAQRAQINDVKHLTHLEVGYEDFPWLAKITEEILGNAITYANENPELGIWCPSEPLNITPGMTRVGINDLLGDHGLPGAALITKIDPRSRKAKKTPDTAASATGISNNPEIIAAEGSKGNGALARDIGLTNRTVSECNNAEYSKEPILPLVDGSSDPLEVGEGSVLSVRDLAQASMPFAEMLRIAEQESNDDNGEDSEDSDSTEIDYELVGEIAAEAAALEQEVNRGHSTDDMRSL